MFLVYQDLVCHQLATLSRLAGLGECQCGCVRGAKTRVKVNAHCMFCRSIERWFEGLEGRQFVFVMWEQVQRVQSFVEAVDGMKLRNSKAQAPSSSVVVTTQWETFDSGMGSLTAPPPSSIPTITDWERFD